MQPFTLKCQRPGATAIPSAFFVLSRGRHTGRPAFTPYVNCYVFTSAPQYLTSYYWLVYTLWYSRRFETLLRGSCIEFARISDIKQLITDNTPHLEHIDSVVSTLQKLQILESKFKEQLGLIALARRSLLKTD